jgi:hypothetical protein
MATENSNAIRSGVIATVVGGIALAGLAEIWPPIKGVLGQVWSYVIAVFNALTASYSVPLWVLIIISLLAFSVVVRGVIQLRKHVAPLDPLDYRNYCEAYIEGAKWRWEWQGNRISSLWCYCPSCDIELAYNDRQDHFSFAINGSTETKFICENCYKSVVATIKGGNRSYALGFVEREIRRRIRTKEYVNSLK